MNKKDIDFVIKKLGSNFNNVNVPIIDLIRTQTKEPFKILIATILSARTKDETTVKVLEKLFKYVKKFQDIRKYSISEIEKMIYPIGFYKNKAKFISKLPDALDSFGGDVPKTMDELVSLPGVGRKTANIVLVVAYNIPAIAVDTHCHRIPNRWGLIKTKVPLDTEMKLMEVIPKKYWIVFNKYVVAFGQNICRPISPKCGKCPITKYCDYFKKNKK